MNTSFYSRTASQILLFSLLFLALENVSANENTDSEENIEIISVKGQRTLPGVKKLIFKAQYSFYDLYNQMNDSSKFDVLCKVTKRRGSQIADRVCEPRYLKDTRARLIQERAASGLGIDFSKLPTEDEVHMAAKKDKEESIAHMSKIIKQSPELQEHWLALAALVKKYDARKN